MALGSDPKLAFAQVRNIFSSGQAAATNSPLSFMEKTSTATSQLLKEQAAANDNIAKLLNKQIKLLEDIKKDGGGGDSKLLSILGFGAGIKGLGLFKGLTGKATKLAAGVFGKGMSVLRAGLPKMFGQLGTRIIAFSKSFLDDALKLLGKGLRPLGGLMGRLGRNPAFSWILKVGSRITGLAKFIPRLVGKLAWPITALLTAFDGWKGFKESKSVLGSSANLFRRIEYAKASIINGFLIGIPDWITNKLFGKKFGESIDSAMMSIYGKINSLLVNTGVADFKQKMTDLWAKMPSKEQWKTVAEDIKNSLFDLGSYLKSSFLSVLDNMKVWIHDSLSAIGLGGASLPPPKLNDDFMKPLMPKPKATPSSPISPLPKKALPMSVPGSAPATLIPSPASYRSQQQNIKTTMETVITRSYGYASPAIRSTVQEGINAMSASGGAIVSSVAGGMASASLANEQTAEENSEGFFSKLTDGFEVLFKDIGAGAAKSLKESLSKALSKESLDALRSIMSGSSSAADIGSMLGGAGMTPRSAIPGIDGVSGPGGDRLPPKFSNQVGPNDLGIFKGSTSGMATPFSKDAPLTTNGFVKPSTPTDMSKIKVLSTKTGSLTTSNNPAEEIKSELMRNGASEMYANAIVGNMGVESRYNGIEFNPRAVGDSGSAYGLKQWRHERRANLMKFAEEKGLDPHTRKTQAMFAMEESTAGSKYADAGAVKARKMIEAGGLDLNAATALIVDKDERADPARSHLKKRQDIANSLGSNQYVVTSDFAKRMLTKDVFSLPGEKFSVKSSVGGTGSDFAFTRSDGKNVDPRLMDILQSAASTYDSNYKVNFISGHRPGDHRRHGRGIAGDIELVDTKTGKVLDNYQNASTFREYEKFAQAARVTQRQKYPELNDLFKWGGYFSGKKNYGALDLMHFDLGGMGSGGTWSGGLTAKQRDLWPGAISEGMGDEDAFARNYWASRMGGSPVRKVATTVVSPRETTTSSNRFGPLKGAYPQMSSRRRMNQDLLDSRANIGVKSNGENTWKESYSDPLDDLIGLDDKINAVAGDRPSTMTPAGSGGAVNPGKPPMKPADPNLNSPSTPPPPINTIPTTDELSMLMINSEAVA